MITIGCLRALDRTGAPTRIGIAEDSAVVPAGLAEILADSGHAVDTAAGSASALPAAVAEYHRPDAAVFDVRMPPVRTVELVGVAPDGAGIGCAYAVRPSTTTSLDRIIDWTHN